MNTYIYSVREAQKQSQIYTENDGYNNEIDIRPTDRKKDYLY